MEDCKPEGVVELWQIYELEKVLNKLLQQATGNPGASCVFPGGQYFVQRFKVRYHRTERFQELPSDRETPEVIYYFDTELRNVGGLMEASALKRPWCPVIISFDWGSRGRDETSGLIWWMNDAGNVRHSRFSTVMHSKVDLEVVKERSLPLMHFLLRCDLEAKHWEKMGLFGIPDCWWPVFLKEFTKPYFKMLCEFIANERSHATPLFPHEDNTFAWTRYCPQKQVKVVIVGQDPYPTGDKATGLAFSLDQRQSRSKSLKAIFDALQLDTEASGLERIPNYVDLTSWATQGVLLLNAALTVRKDDPESHMRYWKEFTDAVIHYICCKNPHVVFLLWGKKVWHKEKVVDCHNHYVEMLDEKNRYVPKHLVLKSHHPVWNGCHCPKKSNGQHLQDCMDLRSGFHFSRANKFLKQFRLQPVEWTDLRPRPPHFY